MRAIRNPELVLLTLKHAREHGVRDTVELVRGAVSDDTVLGYSCAGVVLDSGGIAEFSAGQRVACGGAGNANHAEVVSVPGNLVVPVPDGVELRDAAFATVGAIAMQGVRRTAPTLGERVVVVGLGLLGLLTVQILRAAGCPVLGIEPDERRRKLAGELGAERVLAPGEATDAVPAWSGGHGADAVIVTASTKSDQVVNDAIAMVRRKGRVVPVGDVGLGLERPALYQREADVLISTSYGPGRYDPTYEEGGVDYPISYVRWTENRNMEEFLRLIGSGQVRVAPLVDVEVPVERAPEAYAAIAGDSPPLAAVLTYDAAARPAAPHGEIVDIAGRGDRAAAGADGVVRVALVGAGGFVRATHLPTIRSSEHARVALVANRRGTSAGDVARAAGGARAATDWHAAVEDDEVDLVLIGTRHDSHAEIAAAALRAGKAVFVEKPLGLTREQIDDVVDAAGTDGRLAIGFNRPFAPLARMLQQQLAETDGPIQLVYRVNAPLPAEHWLNDPRQGGGRILGEACHMFDFANQLCGEPLRVSAAAAASPRGASTVESASITISYADGHIATVHYSGLGAASMPKERVEVLRGGRSWALDDFSALTAWGPSGERTESRRPGKGHAELLTGVIAACREGRPLEPGIGAAWQAQSVALAALDSIAGARTVELPAFPLADGERAAG